MEKRVSLVVRVATWRDGSPYGIAADVASRLEHDGVGVVAEGGDGRLSIDYVESQGRGYSATGIGKPESYGTNIEFTVTVYLADEQDPLGSLVVTTQPPLAVQGNVYAASLDAFQNSPAYGLAASFVATALGVKGAAPSLLPALARPETQEQALALLTRVGYTPADDRERAYFAIGGGDVAACVALGGAAVPPLIEALDGHYSLPNAKVVDALAKIGDPRAANPLMDRIESLWSAIGGFGVPMEEMVDAVGATGDRAMLPRLEELLTRESPAEIYQDEHDRALEAVRAAIDRIKARAR